MSLNSEYAQYFFNSVSVSVWHRIFSKGVEWIAQPASSDQFKGAASYPWGNVNLRSFIKMKPVVRNLDQPLLVHLLPSAQMIPEANKNG